MGQFLIFIAFLTALLSSVAFFTGFKGKQKNLKKGRFLFHVAIIATISSTAYLLYLILTHQFQYTYVWNYSSRSLPWHLLYSTFYAGQEGSFHLWAFFMAVLGIFLMPYLISKDQFSDEKLESPVMGTYSLLMAFILFILIVKSPYLYVWESFPKDVQPGYIPEDGRGLNPLLQNFWMAIHPPILFAGFTSLSIPFAFAIAALMKNRYDRWIKLAMPWTLFGGMILGLGIMLGGYWAYGVLGWGGYWGWDPVENSSLVPWIVIVAGIHTMLIEQKSGKFKKTSLLLCILAYVLVLYSTFLTRSGVLGDASVHSFAEPGQEVYLFLIVFLSLFGAGGIGLILFRLKHLKTQKQEQTELLSRETALFIGAVTLSAVALVIAVGTSLPIIAKGTVEPDFYNRMNLPLAILIGLINGFSILLRWKHSEEKQFLKSMYLPLGVTAGITIILVIAGVRDFLMALFAASSFFSFFVNAQIAYQIFFKNKAKAGAYVAHMGLMLLFLGIIASSKYSKEENISLPLEQPKSAMGYKFTYTGATLIPGTGVNGIEEQYHFNIVVENEGRPLPMEPKAFLLQPIMYYSEYSQGIMKEPDIGHLWFPLLVKDFYISPMNFETPQQFSEQDITNIKQGETVDFKGMKIKFIDFDRSQFNRDEMQQGKISIMGAELEVTYKGKTEKVIAQQKFSQEGTENIPVTLTGYSDIVFYLTNISVQNESAISLAVVDQTAPHTHDTPETLVVTASIKPFIKLVWAGTIVMVLGFFFSLVNRYRSVKNENRKFQNSSNNSKSAESTNGKPKTHKQKQNT